MIVVTDGESHDGEELPEALEECEKRNVTRYAIAVSVGVPRSSRGALDRRWGTNERRGEGGNIFCRSFCLEKKFKIFIPVSSEKPGADE